MERVEFIGTSYVGKSTLYKGLSKKLNDSSPFWVEEQFRAKARKKIGLGLYIWRKGIKQIIDLLGGAYDPYNKPSVAQISKEVLKNYEYTLKLCFHEDSITQKGIEFSNGVYLRLLNKVAKYEYYDNLAIGKTLLAEESIIHWHLVLHQLMMKWDYKLGKDVKRDQGFCPKAIVFCYADKGVLSERMKRREESNKINRNHRGKKKEEVLNKIWKKQQLFSQYATIVESYGVPILSLNTEDPINTNIEKVLCFLKQNRH